MGGPGRPTGDEADSRALPIGAGLGVFLVAQVGNELILLDQHAAHERILFDEIMAGSLPAQELLVPIVYEPESDEEDEYLRRMPRSWRPWDSGWARGRFVAARGGSGHAARRRRPGALFELLRIQARSRALRQGDRRQAACRAAVMDGDELDESGAGRSLRRPWTCPTRAVPTAGPSGCG